MKEIPLSAPNLNLEIVDNLKECIETGWVSTGGKFISEFEEKVAVYMDVEDAVACQSGTAGLHTSLRILGVEPEDEVIVPTLTFVAAVNPIKYLGANPVFMDCDDTLCIDVDKLEVFLRTQCKLSGSELINNTSGKRIKAIIPVHIFGNLCDMDAIVSLAKKYNLKVIEDATEALGSYYTKGKYKGKYAGTIGDMGVLSFNANKIITTGGGGMILSGNKDYLDEARYLTTTAKDDNMFFVHNEIGYNYRMLNLQAALGVSQIDELESFIETKRKNFEVYSDLFTNIEGLDLIPFNSNIRANHWFYSLLVDNELFNKKKKVKHARNYLLEQTNNNNVHTRPIWALIHSSSPYKDNQAYEIVLAEYYKEHVINIPCSSNLKVSEVEYVAKLIIDLLR